MITTDQYSWLFRKGLDKTKEELLAYADEENLWVIRGEIKNSSGHLAQHLAGNLKLFVGKVMGGIDYTRERDREFNERQFTREQLVGLLEETAAIIEQSLTGKDAAFFDLPFPHEVVSIKEGQTNGFMLTYLYAHLNYHLGQINYHRRLIQQ